MKRALFVVAGLLAALLPSCTTYHEQQFVGATDYDLARRESPDGVTEVFRLRGGRTLQVKTEYERQRPFLGFQVDELDKARAAHRGLQPYTGLLVTGAYPASSARLAGAREGDILLALDGREVIYLEQLAGVERSLADGQAVLAKLRRGDDEIELELRTQLLQEDVTDSQSIGLEAAPTAQRAYAGVSMFGIPRVWCERIFGEPRDAVVVSTVEVGSPAWLAGIRGGDVIEAVDGAPVPPVAELSRLIAAKGPAGSRMLWRVRREAGTTYEAELELEDYSGESHLGIPLLFSATNGTAVDHWNLGLGLVMSNRNRYVADTSTRRVQTRNTFSAILGLFKVDATPDETRVRLLWFIRFDT